MTQALKFARLQLLAIKPYVKSLLIILVFAVVYAAIMKQPYSLLAMTTIYLILFITYPFVISEKNNLDALYTTLALTRRQVVAGTYLLIIGAELAFDLFALIAARLIAAFLVQPFDWPVALFTAAVCFLGFSLVAAFQIPIYFKLGYTKAKLIAYLPMIFLALPAILLGSLKTQLAPWLAALSGWISSHPMLSIPAPILTAAVFVVASAAVAFTFYRQRDF